MIAHDAWEYWCSLKITRPLKYAVKAFEGTSVKHRGFTAPVEGGWGVKPGFVSHYHTFADGSSIRTTGAGANHRVWINGVEVHK